MQSIRIEDIEVLDNRQRRAFDPTKLEELIGGILSKGLFHPIVLRKSAEGTFTLVAGERRLRAITVINERGNLFSCNGAPVRPGEVPYILLSDLAPDDYVEAELEENLLRVDLTWQERTKAIADLHRLRKKQDPEHTRSKTAEELSQANDFKTRHNLQEVTNAVIVEPHLNDPDVAKAKSVNEALRIAARKLESTFAAELHRREGAQQMAEGNYPHTLLHGSLVDIMPTLPEHSFSMIIADPPYGIDASAFGDAAQISHGYDDSPEAALSLCHFILEEGYRVTKREAALFMFCDVEHFVTLRGMAAAAGWKCFRTPLIWYKGNARGHMPWQDLGPRRTHELILFATKGQRKLRYTLPDVIHVLPVRELRYAAEKPHLLYAEFIRHFAHAGEHILDPCCGVGPALAAGYNTHTKVTAIEQDAHAHGLAAATLQASHERWAAMMGGVRG